MKKISGLILSILFIQHTRAQFQFISPLPGSKNLPIEHNIIIRQGSKLDPASVEPSLFIIQGSKSGEHSFEFVLCNDGKTINLNPVTPFAFDETITVSISKGLVTKDGIVIDDYSFTFTTHREWTDEEEEKMKISKKLLREEELNEVSETSENSESRNITGMFTVTTNIDPSPGNLFFDCRSASPPASTYNSIVVIDNDGDSVFQRTFTTNPYDFQIAQNGYLETYQGNIDKFLVMDSNFAVIDTYAAANGYAGDPHELRMLANGYAFLIGDENQIIFLPDSTTAQVAGKVIQEFDPDHNVVFEWRSFDHIWIDESQNVNLNVGLIDYIHTNSIEVDNDGNILVSHRHLDQITKIDVNTGEFIWRLGGLYNEFTFTNDSERFSYQHDCRRLENGNITLYDDGNFHIPAKSYAKEYQLDEVNKTATLVWSYAHPNVNGVIPYYSGMGSVQRLANGNTFIGWGYRVNTSMPSMTEVDSAGNIVWELTLSAIKNLIDYRAHKYEWNPCARPTFKLMSTSDITAYSAKLLWHAVANPSQQYEVQYKKHVDSVWIDKKVNPTQYYLDLVNLEPNTEYDWCIQSWCDTVAGISSHFTGIFNFTTLLPTGINEAGKNDVELYPNPVRDVVNIVCTFQVSEIRVLNLLGQEVKNYVLNEEGMDQPIVLSVSNLAPGNYLVEVTGEETREIRKLIVE